MPLFSAPVIIFSPSIILGRGHFCRHSRQSGDDRKCPGRRMGLLRRRVIMEAAAPGGRRGTPLSISGGHVPLGLLRRRSNKSVLFGCPCTRGGSSVTPLLTAVVGGVLLCTCPDFLTGAKTSRAHFRDVSELSKPTFHPVRKGPERLPAVVRTSRGIAKMLPTIHCGTYLMQLISCRVKEKPV